MRSTPRDELVPDEDLALRARGGDREAFSSLYERHAPGLYDFAARITRDREAAADVVQTTFTKAWTNLSRTPDVRNVKAWLFAIARNAAIDEVRHRQRERPPGGGEEDDDPFAALPAAEGSGPESRAQQREVAELVWAAASALGPQEYALLDLHCGTSAPTTSRTPWA
jgi:RNA polymerase sigma-70 factor (ECF subfamily)